VIENASVGAAPALTPFIPAQRATALAAFDVALRSWLGLDGSWAVRILRPSTVGPTSVTLKAPSGEAITMLVHGVSVGVRASAPLPGWVAGPISLTFERPPSGDPRDPNLRALLRRLATMFDAGGAEVIERGLPVHQAHAVWARLAAIEDRFYRHIEHAHTGATGLLRAGFRCNQDCHFCWQGRDWPSAPDELVFRWLDELAAHGVRRLTICGGEPTIWRPLPELIERAHRKYGMRVHMNTNAIRMRQDGFAARIAEAGLDTMLVSLHSHDPEISDRMTRAPGTHARTVLGIQAALDAGIAVVVNCAVERDNVETLADHARFVVRELVDGRARRVDMVNYSQPGRYHDEVEYLERIVPIDVAREHLALAGRVLDAAGVLLEITGSCGFPACATSEITNLVPWRALTTFDAHHRSARTHAASACAGCAAQGECIGPRPEYLRKFGERGLVPYRSLPTSDWYERLHASPLGGRWSPDAVADDT
jgi:pyruvate-formate lyase-activating enzyme